MMRAVYNLLTGRPDQSNTMSTSLGGIHACFKFNVTHVVGNVVIVLEQSKLTLCALCPMLRRLVRWLQLKHYRFC